MAETATTRRTVYQLPGAPSGEPTHGLPQPDRALGFRLLSRSVGWFIHLRWIVVSVFFIMSALSASGAANAVGLHLSGRWLLGLAVLLGIANLGFLAHARTLREEKPRLVHVNLWGQITLDLLAVSVVVHFVGSTHTYAPFLFLVHIILACIFFGYRESLVVLLWAMVLYIGCVGLEHAGVLSIHDVFTDGGHRRFPLSVLVLHVGSGILLWLTIWALVSHLSANLRKRQREVLEAQQQTLETFHQAQEHMRHTAHQMKAPLDAIQSTVSLIQNGYAGETDPKVGKLLDRINLRAEALSDFVGDVLQLARLKAGQELGGSREQLSLDKLVRQVVEALEDKALGRRITLQCELETARVEGDREALTMLVDNLVSNAINYSRDQGNVRISCGPQENGMIRLVVQDQGIGIPSEKLPRIFEEYYRTSEAKAHNRESTGVGLAIVREVARAHGCQVAVESEVDQGTRFQIDFPSPHQP